MAQPRNIAKHPFRDYSIAGMMVAVNDGTGLQYFLTDHLGSTVAVTNSSGTLTSQQRYLPFGAPRAIPNSPILGTDFTYTGQRKLDDGMGGIMDYRARFYSPALGRFLQPDSIIPNPASPQSLNRFGYVGNNPIVFNDPTGHIKCEFDEQGNDYCYENDRKTKIIKEPGGGGDGGGGGGSGGGSTRLICKLKPSAKNCPTLGIGVEAEANFLFNPFFGTFSTAQEYYTSDAYDFDLRMADAYSAHGIDINVYASLGVSNPVSENTVGSWEEFSKYSPKGAELLVGRVFLKNGGHSPYTIFLEKIGLRPTNQATDKMMNYESNYLNALMLSHPAQLDAAKREYIIFYLLKKEQSAIKDLQNQGAPWTTDK